MSNFSITLCDDDLLLLCKTHYLKRFKEGGSYVGDEKFNKHRRMGGSGGNSADNLAGDSIESQKMSSNKEMVQEDILNNRDHSIVPLAGGMSSSMGSVMMNTDGMEHTETESSSSSKYSSSGYLPPPPPPQTYTTTSTIIPSYFSGKMDTTSAMDVSSSSKQTVEMGTPPVSNSPSPRKRGVSPSKFGAFLGIASFETTSSSTDRDNTSAMEVCSSSPTKSTDGYGAASMPDSPSKFGAFLGLSPVVKMPPSAPPVAPIFPPAAAPSSSSSSSSSSSAMAGSRAAQEALDRAMVSVVVVFNPSEWLCEEMYEYKSDHYIIFLLIFFVAEFGQVYRYHRSRKCDQNGQKERNQHRYCRDEIERNMS